ncbi:CRISPR-associated helicase Cas3' [uncultured Sanguibacteroides sp.]|uniref:CRISPR-associated helicase Cas3' n=1 Tax=uncultured Sanguibacteroides sp. TaxID=1635151 RepID=UPI002600D7FF|nr:CRISPR-associated helicase Cas3' [uncultured Sanguibacteroides sp.]
MNIDTNFQVLAKSEPEITLKQHIEDCLNIYRQLRFCFPNLPVLDKDYFWKQLYRAVVMHDLGKAHPEFQRLLRKIKKHEWHQQRHELFSLYFLYALKITEEERKALSYAVAGHHKQLNELFDFISKNYKTENENELLEEYGDGLVEFMQECAKIDYAIIKELVVTYIGTWNDEVENFDISNCIRRLMRESPNTVDSAFMDRLLLVGGMKQCDHMASAGMQTLAQLKTEDFDFLFRYPLYFHQQMAFQTIGNVITNAPTGSGKTETALLWLRKQMEERGQGRAFYILPFTASINAMYERLDKELSKDEKKVGMLHGKLAQYLEYRMSEEDDVLSGEERKQLLEDFKSLQMPLKIVTPFQLLKHLFGLKNFEKGMFEWSGCYLIFDEIHAYDPRVFAQIIVLLKFMLRYMNARVHIMTATLPQFMCKELEQVLGDYTHIQASTDLYEKFTRHRIHVRKGKLEDSLDEIQGRLDKDRKVLVVCNTIAESQKIYHALDAKKKVLLHGSFNAEDRFAKEKILKDRDVKLLVGTQAIEVSLDIDYDCIYTEPAPLDALIQRFGRVNRKREKDLCDCCVFEERNETDKYIYRDEIVIFKTLEVLMRIERKGGVIKETYLQDAINFVYPDWSKEAKEEYEQTVNLLEYAVFHELSPLKYSSEREEQFHEQFTGVQVLPVALRRAYQEYLEANQFVKAEGLLVNLNERSFIGLLKKQQAYGERFVFTSGLTEKMYDKYTYLINRKYSKELGLLKNEIEQDEIDYFL